MCLKGETDKHILAHFHKHLKSIEIVKKDILFANNQIRNMKSLDIVFIVGPHKKSQMSGTASLMDNAQV